MVLKALSLVSDPILTIFWIGFSLTIHWYLIYVF
jgi:hypothetical protein